MDVAQGGAAQADGGGHIRQLGVHQHHVRCVDGNIGACTDGDAGVGAGQGRGVVDAVAHHGHLAGCLQLADDGFLAVGQHACDDFVHTGLPANGVGGALVVAGEHHHADAHVLQFLDGAGAVFLDGIRHRDDAQQPVRAAEEQRRLAHAVQLGRQTVARQGREVGHLGGVQLLRLGVSQHSAGQRMLAFAFQRGGQGQQFGLSHAVGGQDVGDLRLAAGDGAGLVQRHDLGAAGSFQRSGSLEQDAVFGAHAVAHHDGHRRGKAKSTGAADDQHRDAAGQRIAQFTAQQQPHDGGDHRNGDDGRHEETGHGIGNFCNGGLGGGGIADHLDDLGKGGVLAHAGGLALEEAGLVGGGSAHLVTLGLVHRDALAGQGALVHGAGAFQHDAVHGHVLARAHHEDVTLLHLLDGHRYFRAVPQQGGGLGGQLHQALEGVGGLALGAGFQHLAHRDEGQDHGRRLKVELHHIVHDQLAVAVHLGAGHGKQRVGAPHKACHGAQRHQRVHVGRAVDEALEAVDEELLVDDHHDARQQQLDKAHGNMVAVKPVGQRPAPHHVAHGEVHQHQQKAHRCDQAALELGRLMVGQGVQIGIGAGSGRCAARSLGAGTIACVLYGFDDVGTGSSALHAHGVGQQAHRAAGDAGHLAHGLFHPGRAGRAAHAGNIELFRKNSLLYRVCAGKGHFMSLGSSQSSSSSFSSPPARRSSATQVPMCWASSSLAKLFSAEVVAATCTRMSTQ